MNNNRRKIIGEIQERLELLNSDIEMMQEEEQDAIDSLPENLMDSERGQKMQEAADYLGYAYENISEALEALLSAQE